MKADRDIDKIYPRPDFIAKLRRLADALEKDEAFDIQISGERIRVPASAQISIEHEREEGVEEIEFQLRWQSWMDSGVSELPAGYNGRRSFAAVRPLLSRTEGNHWCEREIWRPRPESNRGTRICSPLRNHSATRPWPALIVEACGNYNV